MATAVPSSAASSQGIKGPFRLVTVNPQPERAKNVVSKVIVRLQGTYAIEHVGNIDAEDKVSLTVTALKPDILFCASSWSPEESQRIVSAAQAALPELKTYAVPHGLHGSGGPDAVVAHLSEQVGKLLA